MANNKVISKRLEQVLGDAKYFQKDELKIECKSWGFEFTLGVFAWLKPKLYIDRETGALQAKVNKWLNNRDSFSWSLDDLLTDLKLKDNEYSPIFDLEEFEGNTDVDFSVWGVQYKDSVMVLIESDKHNFVMVAKVHNADYHFEDLFQEVDLHGVEFYCGCMNEGKCACSTEFCEISEMEVELDIFGAVPLMDALTEYKQKQEQLKTHPRLPFTDIEFESAFIGKTPKFTDSIVYDEAAEMVYCPNCLEVQPFESAFHLYR